MTKKKILLVEDDSELAGVLNMNLRDLDYSCDHAADGQEGLKLALDYQYSLIILDLMLPKLNGLDLCKRLRESNKIVPILILSAKSEMIDKILGLELGADDYVTKPFGMTELISRIRALLRRVEAIENLATSPTPAPKRKMGSLEIDIERRKLFVNEVEVHLTMREFDLLVFLAMSPGRVFSRSQILQAVWDSSQENYEDCVSSLIKRLRKKIEENPAEPKILKTVRGVGYSFGE